MRTVSDLLGLALFTLLVTWVVLILLVTPDRKPVIACAPLHYSFTTGQRLVDAGIDVAPPAHTGRPEPDVADRATLACLAYIDRYMGTASRSAWR